MIGMSIKKIVIFGAGKIGRSFIGQLFSRAGYEIVFVDKDSRLIEELNRQKSYKVLIFDSNPETIVVENVRGVQVDDKKSVAEEVATADILAVSVGKNGLPCIVPVLSEGLLKREKDNPGWALDIILAENMRNADIFLRFKLAKILLPAYPLDKRVGFIETSIGKMTPLIVNQTDDILTVSAEAYNTLIVNKEGFKNPIPLVEGLEPKENIKAWVDRKLFIHNFGHVAVAYLGYMAYPDHVYTWETLEVPAIKKKVKQAMQQSATILQTIHPGVFTVTQLQDHIDDLLVRFANRSLCDSIFRVGCDLYRKLSPNDRIVTPLMCAYHHKLPYNLILQVLMAALKFKCIGPDGRKLPTDKDFHNELKRDGRRKLLQRVCGFTDSECDVFLI